MEVTCDGSVVWFLVQQVILEYHWWRRWRRRRRLYIRRHGHRGYHKLIGCLCECGLILLRQCVGRETGAIYELVEDHLGVLPTNKVLAEQTIVEIIASQQIQRALLDVRTNLGEIAHLVGGLIPNLGTYILPWCRHQHANAARSGRAAFLLEQPVVLPVSISDHARGDGSNI